MFWFNQELCFNWSSPWPHVSDQKYAMDYLNHVSIFPEDLHFHQNSFYQTKKTMIFSCE